LAVGGDRFGLRERRRVGPGGGRKLAVSAAAIAIVRLMWWRWRIISTPPVFPIARCDRIDERCLGMMRAGGYSADAAR